MADKRPVAVARAVLCDGHRQLYGHRKDTGRWEFPGGKIEFETVTEAARREVLEETGLVLLGHPEFVGYTDCRTMSGRCHALEVFLAFPEWLGELSLEEGKHVEWQWLTVSEAMQLDLMPSTRVILENWWLSFCRSHPHWPPFPAINVGPVS